MKLKYITAGLLALMMVTDISAQQKLTKDQIMSMSIEELSDLPLEELMEAVETLGVSSVDELFAMIMNKNVSSASKKEEDSFKSPLSSTVITREEMRTYGITSIEEAFRLIPGMIVSEKTNGIYDVQMRGLNNIPDNNMFLYTENANTLIMIDGRPVQSYVMGSCNFDLLPISIEDVDRIEVVRGACGALYGANAVSGVINILTEKPTVNSDIISGSIQMGSQNTYIGDVAFRKAVNDKIAFGATINMQYRERPTSDIYVIPGQNGLYYCNNSTALEAVMPICGSEQMTPYYYGYMDENGNFIPKQKDAENYYTQEEFMAAYQKYQAIMSTMQEAINGGYYNTTEIDLFKQLYPTEYDSNGKLTKFRVFDAKEPETLGSSMFTHPQLSRKTMGANGYLHITPSQDININITGGYQNSFAMASPVGDDIFSFNTRTFKTAYGALDATIKDLHLNANYNGGVGDYANGVPGFKIKQSEMNLSAEYDFYFGDLNVRPGIVYQRLKYDDYVPEWVDKANYKWAYKKPGYKYTEGVQHLSGFLYYGGELTTIAPSVRVDYKINDLRLIGAYRADKTNIPDKWQHSWQFAASYSINDNNFVRLVYGRANRGPNLVNSTANFDWERTNMVYPRTLHFEKNEEAPLVKIDNIEIGYRLKPAKNILIDAEAFYSMSDQYGALMAEDGKMFVTQEELGKIVMMTKIVTDAIVSSKLTPAGLDYHALQMESIQKGIMLQLLGGNDFNGQKVDMGQILQPFASIKYHELPYKVKQMGISLNMDYIISSKLIAKLNANIQRTTIDDYYPYNQTDDIKLLLSGAQNAACMAKIIDPTGSTSDPNNYDVSGDIYNHLKSLLSNYIELRDSKGNGNDYEGIWMEAADKTFGDTYDPRRTGVSFGAKNADEIPRTYKNGHAHKATPAFYGMVGMIYKPTQQLEIAAFANIMGKRTYLMKYGSSELDNRCTVNMKVGYKPIENLEVFANAHNLFNSQKREFTYSDKIGGIYTVGVNFGF